MNLHEIAAPFVGIVNEPIVGKLLTCTGYTTAATGKQTPAYATTTGVEFQVQALTGPELAHVDGLNIQGVKRAVYCPLQVSGVDRTDNKGGDILEFSNARWLVLTVLETWPDWSKVAVVKQTDGVTP